MKVLFVAGEALPFSKTGGLGDVMGALPKELVKQGIDARVVIPKHKSTKEKYQDQLELVTDFRVHVKDKEEYAGIERMIHQGVTFYFIDNEYYFGYRDTLYGHYDDGERYGFFNNAVLTMLEELDFYPDIIHVNDWQGGLIPYLLKVKYNYAKYQGIRTLFTIHNIAYQGRFSKELIDYLNVDMNSDIEFGDMINFLKAGIQVADYVSTVSERYAEELLYSYYGYGMDTILETRKDRLSGIINGVDYDVFNPKIDEYLKVNYSLHNYLKGKQANREYLQKYYRLEDNDLPIIGMVSRLTEAKGFDIIKEIIEEEIKNNKFMFVILGSGDPDIENYYRYLREKYPTKVGVYIGYNEKMARKIYAGSDLFLMPSRFEPCGLSQIISLKYGTLPIVRKTGGLRDTIEVFNKYTGEGNGFGFENFDSNDLRHAINEALSAYKQKPIWKKMIRRAMNEDFSWNSSAQKYIKLYQEIRGN